MRGIPHHPSNYRRPCHPTPIPRRFWPHLRLPVAALRREVHNHACRLHRPRSYPPAVDPPIPKAPWDRRRILSRKGRGKVLCFPSFYAKIRLILKFWGGGNAFVLACFCSFFVPFPSFCPVVSKTSETCVPPFFAFYLLRKIVRDL